MEAVSTVTPLAPKSMDNNQVKPMLTPMLPTTELEARWRRGLSFAPAAISSR